MHLTSALKMCTISVYQQGASEMHFEPLTPGAFRVTSDSGNAYVVRADQGTCSCPSFRFRGPCKHLRALAAHLRPLGVGGQAAAAPLTSRRSPSCDLFGSLLGGAQ